jgi:hypothetical protein
MHDESHLNALRLRLSNERIRLSNEKTESGKALRCVWVNQIEKEIESEKAFLDISESTESALTDSELLAELGL